MRKAFIILGNGFTIDFLQYYSKVDSSINEKIDVCNLFRLGDKISTPWEEKPGFLSFKNCPALWTLGARPYNTKEESNALIEEIITCANMFFDFVNEPEQKTKRLELTNSNKDKIYLRAYSELNMYLRHLFSSYNTMITDKQLEKYMRGTYLGVVKGNYDTYCRLNSKEINNFVQNAGKYADLVIIKLRSNEIMFDTKGQFIHQILPELSETARTSYEGQKIINQIASKLNEMIDDSIEEKPIKKVERFIKEAFGQEMIENDIVDSLKESEQNVSFQGHIF